MSRNGRDDGAWARLHRRVARLREASAELTAEAQREVERARSLVDTVQLSRQARWLRRYEQARARHQRTLDEKGLERG